MRNQSFIGSARTSIDGKGRTSFPKEYRRAMSEEEGNSVVVTIGPRNSLILYTMPEWNQFMDELARYPRTPDNDRNITRLKSFARECELDGQNRILLSTDLMRYALLEGEVLFAPRQGKTLGLWNPQRHEELYGLRTEADQRSFDDWFFQGPEGAGASP